MARKAAIESDIDKRYRRLLQQFSSAFQLQIEQAIVWAVPRRCSEHADEDRVMQGEIFGPILPILRYSKLHEAITQIKLRPRPLAGYIFSRNQTTIDEFVSGFSFGGGAVNQTNVHVYLDSIPFGGVGESGIGSGNGKYGYDSMTHAKSILISPPDASIDHVYPPYTMDKIQALNQWLDYWHPFAQSRALKIAFGPVRQDLKSGKARYRGSAPKRSPGQCPRKA